MALAETAELVAELNLKGDFQRKATAARGQLKAMEKDSTKLKAAFGKMGQGVGKAFGTIVKGATVAGVAVLAVGGKTLSWAADFEEQLGTINTVAKVTPKELDAIGDSLKGLAETTGTSLDDLSSAYYDLVSAGVDAADAQNVLTQANKLAIGGLSTTAESVDLLTTAINAYGLDAKDAAKITDGFAQSIAAGKVTASELASSFADVAPFAADLGIEIEELQAGYALLTAKGIKAAQAGTYMRSAVVALLNPTADLQKLQAELNVDFAKMARDRGLVYAYEEMSKAAEEAGIPMQKLTGRIEGAAFATNTAGRNFRSYNRELENVKNASNGAGVATQQMAERQKGVNASLRRLRETARVTGIEFAEGLLPGVAKGFDAIATKVRGSRRAIKSFGDTAGQIVKDFFSDQFVSGPDQGSITKVASPFSRLSDTVSGAFEGIQNLPWGAIKENFGFVTRVAGEALRIFQSLPPEMQGALVTLLAANKLTGGLVGSALKDIAGLALKSLTTIMAGNVTVVGKTVTGPGSAPAAPGAPGGVIPMVGAVIAIEQLDIAKAQAQVTQQMRENGFYQTSLLTGVKGALTGSINTALATIREKSANLVGISGTGNDLLRGIESDAQKEREMFSSKLTTLTAKSIFVGNAVTRSIPILGDVRAAVGGVTRAVQAKDLSVRVAVQMTATTVAEGVARSTTGNRVVIS